MLHVSTTHRCYRLWQVLRVGRSTLTRIRYNTTTTTTNTTSIACRRQHPTTSSSIKRRRRLTTKTEPPQPKPETTPPLVQQQQQQNYYGNEFYFYGILVYRLMMAYGGIYCISEYGFQLTNCNGPSMLPTMNPIGEIIFIDRLTPRLYGLEGGCSKGADRVRLAQERQRQYEDDRPDDDDNEWHQPMIPCNEMPQQGKWKRFWHNLHTGISRGDVVVVEHPRREGTVCKRVLGLPGDEIIVKKSQYNASHFRHGSRKASPAARKSLYKVPDGHVWLEGDNSANSLDSRSYGTVPAAMIVGRVPFRVWPLRGNAMMERGMRPSTLRLGEPKWGSQGSTVLPAGYGGQRIVKQYRRTEQ